MKDLHYDGSDRARQTSHLNIDVCNGEYNISGGPFNFSDDAAIFRYIFANNK